MGNCFKASTSDGFSLLRDSEDADSNPSTTTVSRPRGTAPPPYQDPQLHQPVDNGRGRNSNINQPAAMQLTEEEQIRIAKRMGLINHLPSGIYDGSKKTRECVICMGEFAVGDCIRYLPCLHTYHRECIDDWMMRSFTCPSCMEPIDAALLMLYETN